MRIRLNDSEYRLEKKFAYLPTAIQENQYRPNLSVWWEYYWEVRQAEFGGLILFTSLNYEAAKSKYDELNEKHKEWKSLYGYK